MDFTEITARGAKAKKIAEKLILGKQVLLILGDRRYGFYNRLIAVVKIAANGHFIDYVDWFRTKHPELVFK